MKLKKCFMLGIFFLASFFCFSQEIKAIKITDLEKTIAESKAPLIINFWATFCKPCVQEIPYFQKLVKDYEKNGLKLLLVSLDMDDFYPEKIKKFAARQHFTAPILWLNETNADYFCPKVDTTWSGVIPASLFVNHTTGYRKFFEDKIPESKLRKEIEDLVAPGQSGR